MNNSPNLSLPFIAPAQAQKHVTHNEAIQLLDSLVQLAVQSQILTSPPADAVEGDRYLVAQNSQGAWSAHDGDITTYQENTWMFISPKAGWLMWVIDEQLAFVYSGTDWVPLGQKTTDIFGVNTQADATNKLAVKSDAVLLSHDDVTPGSGDMRLVFNKSTPGATGSLLFQTGFSGRSELGLSGDDDFHIKVSPDGTQWFDVLVADRNTGQVSFPSTEVAQKDVINMYPGHGRFAVEKGITIGAFVPPSYFVLGNGALISSNGKFIHNNSDYGGSAGTLNPDVKLLIDKIRDVGHRRYGVEFYVAKITAGSSTTGSPLNDGTSNYYFSLLSQLTVRPSALTTHHYIKAVDDDIMYGVVSGQKLIIEGTENTTPQVIRPSDGWVSVSIQDNVDPHMSFGYQPNFTAIHCKAAGDGFLMACPSITAGLINMDINAGLIMSYDNWN